MCTIDSLHAFVEMSWKASKTIAATEMVSKNSSRMNEIKRNINAFDNNNNYYYVLI